MAKGKKKKGLSDSELIEKYETGEKVELQRLVLPMLDQEKVKKAAKIIAKRKKQ